CIFFFQAEDGIRDFHVTGVQTCALPIYSLPGLVINAGAGLWWAAVFQKLFGEQADRRGPMVALAGGLATAGLAYVVDYKLVPKRLTPGWELRISDKSLYMSLAAMGLGLGVGAILRSEEHTSELQSRENLVCRLL